MRKFKPGDLEPHNLPRHHRPSDHEVNEVAKAFNPTALEPIEVRQQIVSRANHQSPHVPLLHGSQVHKADPLKRVPANRAQPLPAGHPAAVVRSLPADHPAAAAHNRPTDLLAADLQAAADLPPADDETVFIDWRCRFQRHSSSTVLCGVQHAYQ